jgi:hypothetical protein
MSRIGDLTKLAALDPGHQIVPFDVSQFDGVLVFTDGDALVGDLD